MSRSPDRGRDPQPHGRRILIAAPQYPPKMGGIERHVERLAEGLVRRGVRVDVAAADPGRRTPGATVRHDVVIRRFPTIAGDATYLAAPRLGAWVARHAHEYDLVHVHGYHALVAPFAALAARRRAVPVVVTPHYHGTGHTPFRRLLHVPYRPLGRLMMRAAAHVISCSEAERNLLEAHFGPLPGSVIPNGVDVADLTAASAHAIPPGQTIVLTVGRLEAYKGSEQIVAALASLPADHHLVVVGQGPLEADLRILAAKLGVSDRLHIHHDLSADDLYGWYRAATVYVSMSRYEAFGICVLEGVVGGASAVVSRIAAHQEIAAYVPPGTVDLVDLDTPPAQLADAIVRAAGRQRASSTSATDRAARVPTWDQLADRALVVYDSVIAGERGRDVSPGSRA